jgi:hypothetical protein
MGGLIQLKYDMYMYEIPRQSPCELSTYIQTNEVQEDKTGPVQGLEPVGGRG